MADSRFAQFASSDPSGPDTAFWNQRVYFDGVPRRRREIVPTLAVTPGMTERAARLLLVSAAIADGMPPAPPPVTWSTDGLSSAAIAHIEKLVEEEPALIVEGEIDAIEKSAQYRPERLSSSDKKRIEELEQELEEIRAEELREFGPVV